MKKAIRVLLALLGIVICGFYLYVGVNMAMASGEYKAVLASDNYADKIQVTVELEEMFGGYGEMEEIPTDDMYLEWASQLGKALWAEVIFYALSLLALVLIMRNKKPGAFLFFVLQVSLFAVVTLILGPEAAFRDEARFIQIGTSFGLALLFLLLYRKIFTR